MKKIKFNIGYLTIVLTIIISSCLKDEKNYWDYSDATSVIEFSELKTNGLIVRAIDILPSLDITATVNLASPNETNVDIPVKLALSDQSVIDTLNAQRQRAADAAGEDFTPFDYLPDSVYSIVSLDVTIPAGKRTVDLTITINSSKISLAKNYILPLKIAQIPDGYLLSSNFNEQLINVVVKNKYDGVYEVTGTLKDNVVATISGYYPVTFQLITTGPYQVKVYDNIYGYYFEDYGHSILNGSSISGYGSFALLVNFDPSGSGTITSVINSYGQPATNTRSAKLDPSGVNIWDPVTKNITIKYFMIQTNSATGSNPRTIFDEAWTYKKAR